MLTDFIDDKHPINITKMLTIPSFHLMFVPVEVVFPSSSKENDFVSLAFSKYGFGWKFCKHRNIVRNPNNKRLFEHGDGRENKGNKTVLSTNLNCPWFSPPFSSSKELLSQQLLYNKTGTKR